MKGRIVVLDHLNGRPAAALMVDGRLEDIRIDPPEDAPPQPGAILRAVCDRPMKGQGGMMLRMADGIQNCSGLAVSISAPVSRQESRAMAPSSGAYPRARQKGSSGR